jgi:UDP-glucose-4-epimerase GalE
VLDPARYYGNNVASMVNLLDACREGGVEGFVFSSTAATYGEPGSVPITEDHPQRPINPYGRTKLVGEGMLRDYERAYGMRWVALRYFNAAGADPRGRLGEHHEPETHLIPLVLQTALGRRKELDVYGTDYDTPDGSCIRDYVHVTDLARAHVLALEHLLGDGESDAFNLGNSQGTSVLEVLSAAENVTGGPVARRKCPRREGDPAILVADPGKITRALGWRPEYPDIVDIVRTTWDWMSAHPRGYGS